MFTELSLFMCRLLKIEYHWKTCRIGIAVAEISADTPTDVWLETQCFQKKCAKDGNRCFQQSKPKKFPGKAMQMKTSRYSDIQ